MKNHRGIASTPTAQIKSNSPFSQHNKEWLSVSEMNTWVSDPASVLFRMKGGTDEAGPSAWRGSSAELAFSKALQDPLLHDDMYCDVALDEFDKRNSGGFEWAKIDKERNHLIEYVKAGLPFFKKLGVPTSYQKKIVIEFEELEIPFVGYIDFEFGEKGKNHQIRDCKTSIRRMNRLSDANCRQLALYQAGAGNSDTQIWIDHVTRHEVSSLRLANPKPYLKELIRIALGFRKFLSISSDIDELLSIIRPDYDDWRWSNENKREQAKEFWKNV